MCAWHVRVKGLMAAGHGVGRYAVQPPTADAAAAAAASMGPLARAITRTVHSTPRERASAGRQAVWQLPDVSAAAAVATAREWRATNCRFQRHLRARGRAPPSLSQRATSHAHAHAPQLA